MTAMLEPVVVRLDRLDRRESRVVHRPSGRSTRSFATTQGGVLLASLAVVGVCAVVLGGAAQLTLALGLGLGAVLAVAFLLGRARQRARSPRIAVSRTRGILADAADAGSVHGWIEGLTLPEGSVGHLVLNPAGAFVVSSSRHATGLSDAALEREATEVRAAAGRTRELLRARGIETVCRPLVAVWGAAGADLPGGGVESGGVLVLRGEDLGDLLSWAGAKGGSWSHARSADLLLDLSDVPAVDRTLVVSDR